MAPGFFGCLSAAILIILAGLYGYIEALNLSTIASLSMRICFSLPDWDRWD